MPQGSKPHQNIYIRPIHVRGRELEFKSIITQYTDQWSPQWSATNVYGRMDPISFYGGTKREFTLGFRVIGEDAAESAANTRNIQTLIQYQYPRYVATRGGQNTIAAPPYFGFRFLNLLSSTRTTQTLYGYIMGSIQVQPGFQDKGKLIHFNDQVDPTHMYFSDVEIVLRIQVLHQGPLVGFSSPHSMGENYPYGVGKKQVQEAIDKNKADGQPQATNLQRQDAIPTPTSGGEVVPDAAGLVGSEAPLKTTDEIDPVTGQVVSVFPDGWLDDEENGKTTPQVANEPTPKKSAQNAKTAEKIEKSANRFQVRGSEDPNRISKYGNAIQGKTKSPTKTFMYEQRKTYGKDGKHVQSEYGRTSTVYND